MAVANGSGGDVTPAVSGAEPRAWRPPSWRRRCPVASGILALLLAHASAAPADSSSPRLAAYYDDFLAICDGAVFQWRDRDPPRPAGVRAVGVGVGKRNRYALTGDGQLLAWGRGSSDPTGIMDGVKAFHAGRSGLLVIRNDGGLWEIRVESTLGFGEKIAAGASRIADGVVTAAVGDSANYYVDRAGRLFVMGLAHRGQYGDGKLAETDAYVQTFADVVQVASHTGHALVLRTDGSVWGTGGNVYGPLGRHGYGDKASSWGRITGGVRAIATGSSHSVAIGRDGSLWIWGRDEGLDPKRVMSDVDAVAAGNRHTIATSRNALWQWETGAKPTRIMDCD